MDSPWQARSRPEFSRLHNTAGSSLAIWLDYAARSMGNSITHVLLGMMICLIVKSIFIKLPEFTYRFDFLQLLLSILEAARLPQRRRGKISFSLWKISIDGRQKFEPILRSKAKNFNVFSLYFVWRSSFDGAENGKMFFCMVSATGKQS